MFSRHPQTDARPHLTVTDSREPLASRSEAVLGRPAAERRATTETTRPGSPNAASALEETVSMRLMSDVPLGMFLSGGVDSSAIAALMKRAWSTGPVKTFSVGYREVEVQRTLLRPAGGRRQIGTDHHEVMVGMEDFFNALPRLIWHEDEPIVWPSSVSLYFVSKLAARGSEGGAYRRGQRRTVCRLRPVSHLPAE